MAEHMHHEQEKCVHCAECGECQTGIKKAGLQPAKIVATSVIVGAILVSLSLIYSSKLILQNVVSSNALLGQQTTQTAVPSQPSQAVATQPTVAAANAKVEVKSRSDAPVLGKASAKVTIVEFSDFQCPYCKQFFDQTFSQIKSQYVDTGKVKIIFRHFPMPFHVNAQSAAMAAECANQQGKFWEYHDLLFKNSQSDGTNLATADLKKYADQLGLNSGTFGFGKNKFNQCLDNKTTQSIVQGDMSDGQAAGVAGTPTFFVNGKQLVGAQPFSAFSQAIDAALK